MRLILLLDQPAIYEWQKDVVDSLHVYEQYDEVVCAYSDVDNRRRRDLFTLINFVEGKLVKDRLEQIPVESLGYNSMAVSIRIEGIRTHLDREHLKFFSRNDRIVRFGMGILSGDVLSYFEKGVLSFHHGDFFGYRGGPSGFWEVLNKRRFSTVTLQLLNETLDNGAVLANQNVSIIGLTQYETRQKILSTSALLIHKYFLSVNPVIIDGVYRLNKRPRTKHVLKYIVLTFRILLRRKLFRDNWKVFLHDKVVNRISEVAPLKKNSFYADPFF